MRRAYGRSRRSSASRGGGAALALLSPQYGLLSTGLVTSSSLASWPAAFGTAPATQGASINRPSVVQDSVTGRNCVRLDSATSIVVPAGTLDFAHKAAATVAILWRQRTYATHVPNYVVYDDTNGGTTPGIQIKVRDAAIDTAGRQIVARVFDGSTWIVDFTASGPAGFYNSLLWSVIVATWTTTSLTIYADGIQALALTFGAVAFSQSAASSGVIGNGQVDIGAFLAYNRAFSAADAGVVTSTLVSLFGLYPTVKLWGDGAHYYADVAGCALDDNTYIALCYHSTGGGSNGVVEARYAPDGLNWTPAPGDGSNAGQVLPFTGLMFDPVVAQLSNGSVMVIANGASLTSIRSLVAASPAAARAGTWTGEATITHGHASFEICGSEPFEDPSNPGTLYLPLYTQNTTEKWDGRLWKTTNYGADGWPTEILVADGVADNINYAELGGQFLNTTTIAKYVDFASGTIFILARDDAHFTMWEFTATSAAGPWMRRATNLVAFSAARFQQSPDGTILAILRDALAQYNCLYERTGVSGGVAQYSPSFPGAATPTCTPGLSGQYGNVCKEVTNGVPLIITAMRYNTNQCDTFAQFFPRWQMRGQMPLIITGASSVAAGASTQLTIAGAGNYTCTVITNNSNSTIDNTGFYIAGVFGSVTDVIQVTDLNGYSKTFSISVGASAWTPWTLTSCKFWVDTVASPPATSGGNLTTWTDLGPLATTMVPGSGAVPVTASDAGFNNRPSLTLGSAGSWLKSSANLTFGPYTQFAVISTSATGYVSVHNVDGGGNGDYWFTSSPGLETTRSGVAQDASSGTWVTGITNGVAHVAEAFFDGVNKANTALLIDGVSKVIGSVTATNLDTTTATGKLYIGGNATGGGNLAGKVAAYGVFDGTISAADRSNVRFYLKRLFGTP